METVLWKSGGALGFLGLLLWVASFADKHADTQQLYRDIWSAGTPAARLARAVQGSGRLFSYLFERAPAPSRSLATSPDGLARRFSITRSAVATAATTVLLTVPGFGDLAPVYPAAFAMTLVSVALTSIVPDAISLLETRWVLRRFERSPMSLRSGLGAIGLDLALTTGITWLFLPLLVGLAAAPSTWTLYEASRGTEVTVAVWLGKVPMFERPVQYVLGFWEAFADPRDSLGEIVHFFSLDDGEPLARGHLRTVGFMGVFTGFATSFWIWLSVLGSWLSGGLRWFGQRVQYPLIARLNVEEHPAVALVIVTAPFILCAAAFIGAVQHLVS